MPTSDISLWITYSSTFLWTYYSWVLWFVVMKCEWIKGHSAQTKRAQIKKYWGIANPHLLECLIEKFEETVIQSLSSTLNANHNIKLPAQYDNHRTTERTKIQLLDNGQNHHSHQAVCSVYCCALWKGGGERLRSRAEHALDAGTTYTQYT